MKNLEKKSFPFTFEKFDEVTGTFSGYASVFNVEDAQGDVVDHGAFKKTLKEKKRHKLFWSHDSDKPGIGYIEPTEDKAGLRFKDAQLYLDIELARAAYINMKNGTLDGVSIGYKTVKEYIDPTTKLRHLKEIALWEISLCNFQACPGALVLDVKSDESDEEDEEDGTSALTEEPDEKSTLILEPLEIVEPESIHSMKTYAEVVREFRESIERGTNA